MYCLIFIPGGLLLMMGHRARSEFVFDSFKLDDYVPETYLLRLHLLRLIDKHVSFAFVREGRPVSL